MSFKDYANFIANKYRLAVAVATIKSKPQDLTIDQYIEELKRKFRFDLDSDDETVCSDDFAFTEDKPGNTVTAVDDDAFDADIINGPVSEVITTDLIDVNMENTLDVTAVNKNAFNADIINDEAVADAKDFVDDEIVSHSSVNLLNDILNDLDVFVDDRQDNLMPNNTDASSIVGNSNRIHDMNLADTQSTFCDSQLTICEEDYIIDNDLTFCDEPTQNFNSKELQQEPALNFGESQVNSTTLNHSQDTEIYSLRDYSQFYTHVSQTQNTQIVIAQKYITNKKTNDNNSNINDYNNIKENDKYSLNKNNDNRSNLIDVGNHKKQSDDNITNVNAMGSNNFNSQYNIINNNNSNNVQAKENIDDCKISNENILNNIQINTNLEPKNIVSETLQELNALNNKNVTEEDMKYTENLQMEQNMQNTPEEEDVSEKEEDSSRELVSFKVIEEMNKIKFYLCKRQETRMTPSTNSYINDSGYSSGLLSSAFKNVTQQSSGWLNQSACTLFNYLKSCPILSNTQEITTDISQVLSKLIDRLHEEENYPSFLDEILEYINDILDEIYSKDSKNLLIDKEENIHRLLLLNKSAQILEYTIDKINCLLQKMHEQISSKNELYEITNTIEIENLSYIFYILEKLIRKYNVKRDLFSQSSTQTSQEEDKILLKRSFISDIWQKKWNPKYKEKEISTTTNEQNSLTRCGDTLNKIIVETIDGYSLIAFSALQCFNLLQN